MAEIPTLVLRRTMSRCSVVDAEARNWFEIESGDVWVLSQAKLSVCLSANAGVLHESNALSLYICLSA